MRTRHLALLPGASSVADHPGQPLDLAEFAPKSLVELCDPALGLFRILFGHSEDVGPQVVYRHFTPTCLLNCKATTWWHRTKPADPLIDSLRTHAQRSSQRWLAAQQSDGLLDWCFGLGSDRTHD